MLLKNKIVSLFKNMIGTGIQSINIKVFITGKIESFNIQLNKYEKIKNIKSIIAEKLNFERENFKIFFNNINIEENYNIQNETIVNVFGNKKIPYLKIFFKNENNNEQEINGKKYLYLINFKKLK